MSNELLETTRRKNTQSVDYKGMLNIVEGQLSTADEDLNACIKALKHIYDAYENNTVMLENYVENVFEDFLESPALLPEHIKARLK